MIYLFYILDENKKIITTENILIWVEWLENSYKDGTHWIADTRLKNIHISTVFLGANHNWGEGDPILFETMVFGGWLNREYQVRYSTYDEALDGHSKAIKMALKYNSWYYLAAMPFKRAWQNRYQIKTKIKDYLKSRKTKTVKNQNRLIKEVKTILKQKT